MIINNNEDILRFSKELIIKMNSIGEHAFAKELENWSGGFYTTSSEFLGEFKMILERVKGLKPLDLSTKKDIIDCIEIINKAFCT